MLIIKIEIIYIGILLNSVIVSYCGKPLIFNSRNWLKPIIPVNSVAYKVPAADLTAGLSLKNFGL